MSPKTRRVVDQDNSKLNAANDDGAVDNKSTLPSTTSTSSSSTTSTTFDQLAPTLLAMNEKFTAMNDQFQELKKVDDSLARFNDAFGAFLFGLSANGTTVQWPKTSTILDIEKYKTPQMAQVAQGTSAKPTEDQAPKKESPLASKIGTTATKDKKIAKKRRKFVTKIDINKIIAHLPLKYREQTEHMKTMETVLRVLRLKPEGMTMAAMVREIGLPQYRVTDCLNALVRSKDVQKFNPKGQLAIYQMDPAKFASH
ncbi:hypothetical protein BCR42DRAFT_113397 [Absidia repens]|uniref:Uncharacterized protein n=1 Tax=Absidia repens TaxID=90262 RepID=A0A1X2I654_9FUNG|nr:hypothetical protein BCR42DRAFT_113397 [Absidia repens]